MDIRMLNKNVSRFMINLPLLTLSSTILCKDSFEIVDAPL